MTAPFDMTGPTAPPRSNGELLFAAPWESRAFGMAVALHQSGLFTWPQFQAALIARIARWEAEAHVGASWVYYDHWLGALEDLLAGCDAVLADDIASRAAILSTRPVGHDHAH
jgi:nitrile hydratase accessory protein